MTIGQTISHYEILERLGEGGMGVVYKARDHNLDRFVAVKVLSPREMDDPADVARFEHEAKTISSLNHPHIATIHDRGEIDGKPYLVLEYLAGGTVRERLQERRKEGGELSLDETLRYAIETSEGLAYAHRRGVIHRDVKPDNLMLSEEGRVKITDFGLAKWNAGARITGHDMALGTAAYMSPEQAQGLEVDERSDVFSFGMVLYELATGEPPFKGLYPAAIVYDILNTPTPCVRSARPDVPEELDQIIRKATAKAPSDRYRTMDDLLADLEALRGGSSTGSAGVALPSAGSGMNRRSYLFGGIAAAALLATAGSIYWFWTSPQPRGQTPRQAAPVATPISIAVLPLENLSRDPAQDYLAEGMTEALITDLAKIPTLRVISRTTVMRYKQTDTPLRQIAEELNVNRIVEGSVLQVADDIRITAQLVDATNDEHLWAESYQGEIKDVLSLQQEVAKSIANQVRAQLTAGDQPPFRRAGPVNPKAYEAYLRGRHHTWQWNREDLKKGIANYKRAIELDPGYGSAYAGLAAAYGFMSLFGGAAPSESWPLARAAAVKALEIDESLEDAHTALGFVEATYDWNWFGAEREFRRALELNPGSALAYHAYAMTCLAPTGRLDEALEAIQKARDLDPLSLAINVNLADIYVFRREYNKAIQQYQRTIELNPNFFNAYQGLGFAYLAQGRTETAAKSFRKAENLTAESDLPLRILSRVVSGNREEALKGLQNIVGLSKQQYVSACQIGVLHLLNGDKDQALEWLERAAKERSGSLLQIKVSPIFDNLRRDPRFNKLLRRMNLET